MKKIYVICFGLFCMNASAQDTVKVKSALTTEQESEIAYNLGLEFMTKKLEKSSNWHENEVLSSRRRSRTVSPKVSRLKDLTTI